MGKKMKQPKFFSLDEMIVTNTGLKNFPKNWEHFETLKKTALKLDKIRELFNKAIKVNSAYRTKEVNDAVLGSKTSNHMKGLCADIKAASGSENDNLELYKVINSIVKKMNVDQFITYLDKNKKIRFFHVGFSLDEKKARNHSFYK